MTASATLLAAALFVGLFAGCAEAPMAPELPVTPFVLLNARLPVGLSAAASAFDGEATMYLFGGSTGLGTGSDQILRYDMDADAVDVVGRLPSVTWGATAVWGDGRAYVFGGQSASTVSRNILEFDPETNQVQVVAQLPYPLVWSTSVFDPAETDQCPAGCAYLLGGKTARDASPAILRFDPVDLEVSTIPATLPRPYWGASAAMMNGVIFVAGGNNGRYQDDVLRFDPASLEVARIARLPVAAADVGMASDGNFVYIMGGRGGPGDPVRSEVFALDPAGRLQELCIELPTPLDKPAIAWEGRSVRWLGGQVGPGPSDLGRNVWQFNPAGNPAPPCP